jgi:hypothetical protein
MKILAYALIALLSINTIFVFSNQPAYAQQLTPQILANLRACGAAKVAENQQCQSDFSVCGDACAQTADIKQSFVGEQSCLDSCHAQWHDCEQAAKDDENSCEQQAWQ